MNYPCSEIGGNYKCQCRLLVKSINSNSMKSNFIFFLFFVTPYFSSAQTDQFEVFKIWEEAEHSAFTDLVWFNDAFYCTFREGIGHIPRLDDTGDGQIRVISSKDGRDWFSVAIVKKENLDLRDSKLSITPDNRLMLLYEGVNYESRKVLSKEPFVSYSNSSGSGFSDPIPVNLDWKLDTKWNWLWRVSWINGIGYGGLYYEPTNTNEAGSKTKLAIITTENGTDYKLLKELDMDGNPNESSMKILPNGEARMIVRREGGDKFGYFGKSKAPFLDWTWTDLGMRIGGPEFIVLPNGQLILGTRKYLDNGVETTSLYSGDENGNMKEVIELPSGGDTSYPGLVWKDGKLFMSYYSSHEGKTSIYLAIVDGEKFK